MAKFYGKSSGYLIKEDLKYFSFAIALLLLILVIVWIILISSPQAAGWAAFVGIVFIVLLADPLITFFKRKSNQFYRGRGGEEAVKKELEKLPEDYCVFQDLHIGDNKGNLDFAVLGKAGLFILEVKSHKGQVGYNGQSITVNGREYGFLRQVHGQTWALKNYLKQRTGKDIHIHSVLVFSSPYASMHFEYNPVSNVYVIGKEFLTGLLSRLNETARPTDYPKLTQALLNTVSV